MCQWVDTSASELRPLNVSGYGKCKLVTREVECRGRNE